MSLVDDDEVGAGAQELVAPSFGLDVVHGDDGVGEVVEEGAVAEAGELTFEPGDGGAQDEGGVEVKEVGEEAVPLLGEVRRAEDGGGADLAAVEELAQDERRLNGLADADVVGDEEADGIEPQGHQEGYELVGPGLDSDGSEGAEGSGGGAEAEAYGVAQEPTRAVVAELGVGIGEGEGVGDDFFEGEVDAGGLVVGADQGTQDEEVLVVLGLGLDDPFTSTGVDQGADGESHGGYPPG